MNVPDRLCPECQAALTNVWRYGDIEMGHCTQCGDIPLATVCDEAPAEVASESEFAATAVNDGTSDFLLRLSRLVPEYNVVQLKKMEITANSQRVVPLGIRTDTVDLSSFMKQVENLGLTVELRPVNED